jgi:AraC-like DNA-binding protein
VIVRAKELLREQRYSVREVSEILNFPSQSFFGRYFKRNMGISPKVFMEQSV